MKLAVPTNFQDDFLTRLPKGNIHYIYGKLASDFVGGGRPSFILPHPSQRDLKEHIGKIHKYGLRFNYLLNGFCLSNTEFTISGQREIRRLLDGLIRMNVDSVTVAIPYLAQLIKKNYPELEIYVSSFSNVDSVQKARYWEDLGVDLIVLPPHTLNRDFETLRMMKKHIRCPLELIANNACLFDCPLGDSHKTGSHMSQSNQKQGFPLNFCALNCSYMRVSDKVNFIRATWIRPEDLRSYEEAGIELFKITDRSQTTDFLIRAATSYIERKYDGNLFDILAWPLTRQRRGRKNVLRALRYLFQPFKINPFFISKMAKLSSFDLRVQIDNKALDGFLDFFLNGGCRQKHQICKECGYCRGIAEKVVKWDDSAAAEASTAYKDVLDEIVSGRPFRYF